MYFRQLSMIQPDYIYTLQLRFREFAESKGCRFLSITRRGESFDITQ